MMVPKDEHSHLEYASPATRPMRSRAAVASFALAVAIPVWYVALVAIRVAMSPDADIPAGPAAFLVLCFCVPFVASTGLAISAIVAIKRARGQLRGTGLAVSSLVIVAGLLILWAFLTFTGD